MPTAFIGAECNSPIELRFSAGVKFSETVSGAVETALLDVLGEPAPFTEAEREACRGVLGVLGVPHGYGVVAEPCDLDASIARASGAPSPSGGRCPMETHAGSCLESCIARGRAAGAKHKVTRSQKTPDHLRSARFAGVRSDEVGPEFRLGRQRAESGADPARPSCCPYRPFTRRWRGFGRVSSAHIEFAALGSFEEVPPLSLGERQDRAPRAVFGVPCPD